MHLLEKYAIKICGFGNTRSQPDQKFIVISFVINFLGTKKVVTTAKNANMPDLFKKCTNLPGLRKYLGNSIAFY